MIGRQRNEEDQESELDLSTYFIDDDDSRDGDDGPAMIPALQSVMGPETEDGDHEQEEEEEEEVTRNAENIEDWDVREPERYDNRFSIPMEEDEEDL